jgi:hypothetical protein
MLLTFAGSRRARTEATERETTEPNASRSETMPPESDGGSERPMAAGVRKSADPRDLPIVEAAQRAHEVTTLVDDELSNPRARLPVLLALFARIERRELRFAS